MRRRERLGCRRAGGGGAHRTRRSPSSAAPVSGPGGDLLSGGPATRLVSFGGSMKNRNLAVAVMEFMIRPGSAPRGRMRERGTRCQAWCLSVWCALAPSKLVWSAAPVSRGQKLNDPGQSPVRGSRVPLALRDAALRPRRVRAPEGGECGPRLGPAPGKGQQRKARGTGLLHAAGVAAFARRWPSFHNTAPELSSHRSR